MTNPPSTPFPASIHPSQAERPLVLALDAGTSSVRALLYDALGRAVEGVENHTPYQMRTTPDGGVEMDADELVAITCRNLDPVLERAGKLVQDTCGVACCTFWHSLLGVGPDGKAVTPIYNWNDTRSREDAADLAARLGVEWVHARTGAVPHASYYPAKLLWLRRTRLSEYTRVARWMSFGEYLHLRLFGRTMASVSMASGTGLLNAGTCLWDHELLRHLDLEPGRLSPLAQDHDVLTGLGAEYAARWPALARLPWLPAVGDGACSNIGSGCVTRDGIALMIGTSGALRVCFQADQVTIPPGLWCYRANRRYLLLGGALSNAGDVYAWCQNTLRLGQEGLEEELAARVPDAHGLTVLPFFSGERSTGWADHARAAVTGMTLNTHPIDMLRAALESVAYRFAAIHDLIAREVPGGKRIIASGGGIIHSPAWVQIMADVLGAPVNASAVPEASSRGAALLALQSLGFLADLEAVPVPLGRVYEPDRAHRETYDWARQRQEALYRRLISNSLAPA
ncbi:MAG TPA: gluconokinase [Terriglobia bacterium]